MGNGSSKTRSTAAIYPKLTTQSDIILCHSLWKTLKHGATLPEARPALPEEIVALMRRIIGREFNQRP